MIKYKFKIIAAPSAAADSSEHQKPLAVPPQPEPYKLVTNDYTIINCCFIYCFNIFCNTIISNKFIIICID